MGNAPGNKSRRLLQFNLRRVLFWVFPLAAISFWIESCRLETFGRGHDNPPWFIAAKTAAVAIVARIWCVLVWEDRRAISQMQDNEGKSNSS